MKFFVSFLFVSLFFVLHAKEINDTDLRSLAKNNALKSVPKNYKELLKILDTVENKLTAKKIYMQNSAPSPSLHS